MFRQVKWSRAVRFVPEAAEGRASLCLAVLSLLLLSGWGCTAAPEPAIMDAKDALAILQAGNARFARGTELHPHTDAIRRHELAQHGQHPYAAIVGCSDSRVPVEIVFDQGLGDLFVIRVAGNVIATDEAGTIEYAVEHMQIPLVIVLGHSNCGAVTAVVNGSHEHGSILRLVEHIRPAVEQVRSRHPGLSDEALVPLAVEQNVLHSMEDLIVHSEVVREALNAGRMQLLGAVYDIDTALVRWLGRHPEQARLLDSPITPSREP